MGQHHDQDADAADTGQPLRLNAAARTPARHIDHLLASHHLPPPLLLAGHGDEPIETQALVAAGRGLTIAYALNVIIDPDQVVARPLSGTRSLRHVQGAYPPGTHSPAITATIDALRQVGQRHRQPGRKR